MDDRELSSRVGRNVKALRSARRLTQQQMSARSGLPRATWANIESGSANPTLTVLHKVASALRVSIEELISLPKASCKLYSRDDLPVSTRGAVTIRKLLPDRIPGVELERMEIPAGSRFTGTPHMPGTREYLTCETGTLLLVAEGEQFRLQPGDVAVFRGDQNHSYRNPGSETSVGYSVVILANGRRPTP